MAAVFDTFGSALISFYNGNDEAKIVMHTEGLEEYELPVSVFFRQADYYPMDKLALSLCEGKVLDIGAGSGQHSLYLQRNNFEVTALDISTLACEVIHRREIKSVINQDIFEYKFKKPFDTWLLLGRSIGAVGSMPKLITFLQLAYKNLSPSGQVILNSTNGEQHQPISRKISIEFSGKKGAVMNWLDIDHDSLTKLAVQCRFLADIVHVEEDGNYLAILRKTEL